MGRGGGGEVSGPRDARLASGRSWTRHSPICISEREKMLLQHTYRGSSFFLGKVTALGVLCCFALLVCLTLLASFFLPSHLSIKHVHVHVCTLKVALYSLIHVHFCIFEFDLAS